MPNAHALVTIRPPSRALVRQKRVRPRLLARVHILNPRTIGVLDAAVALGAPLRLTWTGGVLLVETDGGP